MKSNRIWVILASVFVLVHFAFVVSMSVKITTGESGKRNVPQTLNLQRKHRDEPDEVEEVEPVVQKTKLVEEQPRRNGSYASKGHRRNDGCKDQW